MKIKNDLLNGITNSDVAWRLLPNGTMVESENFFVTTSGGKDVGLGKNILGNILVVDNKFLGGKSYGVGKNSSSNKVYYFVKATDYDYLVEYDTVTNANIIILQSTTGTRLNLKTGERITNIDIYIDPEGNGNLIAWSGDSNPPRIGNIERMKTWGIDGFTAEEIMLIKAPPTYSPVLTPIISTENAQANYLENKYICFGTRFKYKDGYYSAVSSWSKYFFEPKVYDLDFETFENIGMLNRFNSVNIAFETGEREVIAIDLVFKFVNETNIYKVDTFIKAEEGWADNTTQTLEFNNSKVYGILPSDQYFRSFDNVPEMALAQAPIGNRIGFANYKEGKNLIDKNGNKVIMNYTLELIANNSDNTLLEVEQDSVDYNFDLTPVTVAKGEIQIDLGLTQLRKNNSLTFSFKLKSLNSPVSIPPRILTFTSEFKFTLDRDYTDLTDLVTNSTIQAQLDIHTAYFENNGGVSFPVDYIPPYVVLKGFEITNTGNVINITFPIIKYEVDITPDPNIYITDYFYDNLTEVNYNTISVATSLKSFRSYEICMIYRDLQCRKTTALTSAKNTLFIPNENAITQNQIQVNIPLTQKPPIWAKTYKFGIKINQGIFETIPINIFIVDGIYRWIKLDGENKNKVEDGDILIIKRDGTGFLANPIRVKILEVKEQPNNFIRNNSSVILERAGLYAKIKGLDFEMNYGRNEFIEYQNSSSTTTNYPFAFIGYFSTLNDNGERVDRQFNQGSTVTFNFNSNFHNEEPFILFAKTYTAQQSYNNFKEFFDAQIDPAGFQSTSHPDRTYTVTLTRGFPVCFIFQPVPIGSITSIVGNEITLSGVNTTLWVVGAKVYRSNIFLGGVTNVDISNSKLVLDSVNGASVSDVLFISSNPKSEPRVVSITPNANGFLWLKIVGTESGSGSRSGFVNARVNIRYVTSLFIFEKTAKEIENEIFYETPEIYNVVDGEHQMVNHLLTDTYNCFCQGNGVESYQIRDAFNEKSLSVDFSPTAVSEDEYRQVNRYKDITYSGIYNANTNVNKLNEFNLSTGNFKEDIEANYGSIVKIRGKDTNLEVYQEDKVSIVYYGKDLLSNADGSTNLVSIEEVLGKQDTYQEENGISIHPESFDFEAINSYFTDVKGGAVCKKSNNGIFEISKQGQKNHFRKLFRAYPDCKINGKYDQFNDVYILNIRFGENKYETWVYSDADNGWLGRISFNPDDMIRVNNEFISFQNGNVYKGNQEKNGLQDNYNTFFGIQYPSKFSYVVNEDPSIRKNHKAISSESTDAWDIQAETDLNKGYINKTDFHKEEGVYYGFIRSNNDVLDTSLIGAYQGIGNCTINGLTLEFSFELESEVSVGNEIRNTNMEIVGTILSKTNNSLTLNTVNNLINGDFVLCCKPQSIENNNLLGSAMLVTATLNTNKKTEVFALGCEVQISNPR